MATATDPTDAGRLRLAEVPLRGLSGRARVSFPLYIATGPGRFVLYQPSQSEFESVHEDRLTSEGVDRLFILEKDRARYSRRVERELDALLLDRTLNVESRAAILAGVAAEVAHDVFAAVPDQSELSRARRVMAGASSLVIREHRAFDALRALLTDGTELADHSLTVGMLAIGLTRRVGGDDPAVLMRAGMAGLLHDVGRIGCDPAVADPQHTVRGFHLLKGLGLPDEVCDAVLRHHERSDGSGFPDGLSGTVVPELARVVGLVDTFHKLYSAREGGGVFGALRVLGQVYRGCFDPRVAAAFVKMFAA